MRVEYDQRIYNEFEETDVGLNQKSLLRRMSQAKTLNKVEIEKDDIKITDFDMPFG